MTVTETTCEQCGNTTTDESPPPYCSQCGTANPWKEQSAYQFDESDLPIVFSYEVYNDTYRLWNTFVHAYWNAHDLRGSDIDGLPEEFPKMKYCVFTVWFKVTEQYELEGPFLTEQEAKA